jgi:predicted Fe-S protein YdhL (DUF1289 family)
MGISKMKKFVLAAVLVTIMAAPALAQNATVQRMEQTGSVTAVAPAPNGKSVRDMTPAERQAFWDNLPEEDKQRILARRMQAQPGSVPGSGPAAAAPLADTGNPELNGQLARGKAAWDSMSDEQKRAFVDQHKDQIRAAIQGQGGQ